jgi:hypothetical protein
MVVQVSRTPGCAALDGMDGPNRDETYGGSPPEPGPPASYRCFGMEGTARREHAERVTPVPRNGQLSRISTRDVSYSTASEPP